MQRFLHQNQSGRTMFEAISYIMIMILVTMAAAGLVNSVLGKYRMGRINQEITDLKKAVSQRFVAAPDYSDVSLKILCEEGIGPAGLVPNKKNDCKGDGTHAFGGQVEVAADKDAEGVAKMYHITFSDVPQNVCIELGAKVWVFDDGSDLNALQINKDLWVWRFSYADNSDIGQKITSEKNKGDKALLLPAQISDVGKACKEKDNVITWYFN